MAHDRERTVFWIRVGTASSDLGDPGWPECDCGRDTDRLRIVRAASHLVSMADRCAGRHPDRDHFIGGLQFHRSLRAKAALRTIAGTLPFSQAGKEILRPERVH